MDTSHIEFPVRTSQYFTDTNLYKHIKKNFYKFKSCLCGRLYIDKIPKKSTYSIDIFDEKCIYENTPAPNRQGYKIFSLCDKSNEELNIFIKTKGYFSAGSLMIKLSEEQFKNIIKSPNDNMFIICKTTNGYYFVHSSVIKLCLIEDYVKKIDMV